MFAKRPRFTYSKWMIQLTMRSHQPLNSLVVTEGRSNSETMEEMEASIYAILDSISNNSMKLLGMIGSAQ